MMHFFLLQANTAIDSLPSAEAVQQQTVLELLMKGGPVMIPLGILLFITIYLLIERYLTINKASKIDPFIYE
jgi:biopolymer transport protein ExbB